MLKFEDLINKFPHIYIKEKISNLGKLIQVALEELQIIESSKDEVELQDELNNATGKTLDKHGKLVGQKRGPFGDSIYRLLIKSKIRQNLSGGDIPTVNEYFGLILKDNYLGIKEGWDDSEYDNEAGLVIFRYIHEIIEGGIEPVEILKLDGSVELDGEYSLDGRAAGYFDSEIINFAKSLAKKVIAAGVRVVWETPIISESDVDILQDVFLEQENSFETNEIETLDGDLELSGSINLDGGVVFTDQKATLSIYESETLTEEVNI